MYIFWLWAQPVLAAIMDGFSYFFGGFDGVFFTLIIFIAADYVLGVFCTIVEKKWSGKVGMHGILKKIAVLILVGIGHMIDTHLLGGVSALRTIILLFYISYEGFSLLENASAIGLPIPGKLREALLQLRNKSEGKDSLDS